jgi:hypothetical protein
MSTVRKWATTLFSWDAMGAKKFPARNSLRRLAQFHGKLSHGLARASGAFIFRWFVEVLRYPTPAHVMLSEAKHLWYLSTAENSQRFFASLRMTPTLQRFNGLTN